MGTRTPKLNFYKPAFDENGYDDEVNAGFDVLDDASLHNSARYPRVRYAAPWGDDANDGMSWGTAKHTIYGAFDVLPLQFGAPMGEVCFAHMTQPNPNDPQKGIWVCGSSPPNSDWRSITREVRFTGVGVGYTEISGPPGVGPRIGTTNSGDGVQDATKPAIWIGGGGIGRVKFSNISIHRHPTPCYIGPNGLWSNTTQVVGYYFDHVIFGLPEVKADRINPSVLMKAWSFSGYWNDCTFMAGDASSPSPSGDGAVAFLMDAADPSLRNSNESYLQYFNRCFFAGGGVKDKAGGGDIHMIDCFSENAADAHNAPDLWVQNAHGSTGNCSVENFSHYDSTVATGLREVTIETTGDGTWDSSKCIVIGGWQMRTQGPVTNIATQARPIRGDDPVWASEKQIGMGVADRVHGKHPGGPWQFGIQTAIGDNLCVDPSSYDLTGGFSPTRTVNVRAPDGISKATRLVPEGHSNCYAYFATVGSFTNEYVFFGCWQRFTTGPSDQLNPVSTAAFFDTHTVTVGSDKWEWPEYAKGQWQWLSGWWRGNGVSAGLTFGVQVAFETIEVAYPVVFRVASTDLSDAGAAEMARHIGTTPFYLPPNAAGTQVGQKLMAHGGLGVGNSVAATEVIGKAVTKKIQVFDELGNSIGYVPVYSSIT